METRYAICYSVNIPLRSEPADGAEMMTERMCCIGRNGNLEPYNKQNRRL